MRGLEKNRMKRDRQIPDNGHRDSMIESAQWADSMKIMKMVTTWGRKRIKNTFTNNPEIVLKKNYERKMQEETFFY